VLVCLIWGSTWLAIKFSLRDFPPLGGAGLRFLLAGGVLLAFSRRLGPPAAGGPPRSFWLLLGIVMIGVPYACVYVGEQYLPSGLTAVLFATYPLFVALLAHGRVAGERLHPMLLAGLGSGLAGVAILFSHEMASGGARPVLGGLLILTSALCSAASTLLVRTRVVNENPFRLQMLPSLYGGTILLAASAILERDRPWNPTREGVASLVYLSLFGSLLAFAAYFWLMRTIPVSRLAFVTYVTPLVALLLGSLAAGEPLTLRIGAGTFLILGGILLARRVRPGPGLRGTPHT
jgi:drug/metabolite transporter (DMT)-like permease